MGNCCASTVDNHSSPSAAKPSTPDDNEEALKMSKSNNNSTTAAAAENRAAAGAGGAEEVPPSGRVITPNLKMFSFGELKGATSNFRADTVLGEGGFGRVFKGWVDEKTYAPSRIGVGLAIAVKKPNPDHPKGLQQWQSQVKFFGKYSHPNLVKLLGYCSAEDNQRLLVYEYMQNGSLESHLFKKGLEPLPWETRLNIAIGAARGLAFLHTTEKQVIFRDVTVSKILLDRDFNAKLSNFGMAGFGPENDDSNETSHFTGTCGYAAPEFISTGYLHVKSDVYGFGVVLLELLTGLRVLDRNRPKGQHNLVEWARPFLPDKRKLKEIMDPRLQNHYPIKAAFQAAELIFQCLELEPNNRPSMEEVLEALQQINSIKIEPKDKDSSKAAAKQNAAAAAVAAASQCKPPMSSSSGELIASWS